MVEVDLGEDKECSGQFFKGGFFVCCVLLIMDCQEVVCFYLGIICL